MICPNCGYDMGSANKCLRCGYTVKTLAVVDPDNDEEVKKDDGEETIVIDPSETYISSYDDDDDFGGSVFADPFSALFGDVFDPIGDILGGLFGIDIRPERPKKSQHATEQDVIEHKKRKREAAPVVEVKDVEIVDENGNPIDKPNKHKKHGNKKKDGN